MIKYVKEDSYKKVGCRVFPSSGSGLWWFHTIEIPNFLINKFMILKNCDFVKNLVNITK